MNSLEALLTIDDSYVDNHILDKKYYDLYTQIQNSLKELEIIKEYCNISLYEDDIKGWGHIYGLVIKNKKTGIKLKLHINKEEFDLLKKELEK